MAGTATKQKQAGPGRPQKYPLTDAQVSRIKALFEKGKTFVEIEEATGVHEFAILRVRRQMRAEGL
jgi:hypothetical protein